MQDAVGHAGFDQFINLISAEDRGRKMSDRASDAERSFLSMLRR
jgi:hypothetical protein